MLCSDLMHFLRSPRRAGEAGGGRCPGEQGRDRNLPQPQQPGARLQISGRIKIVIFGFVVALMSRVVSSVGAAPGSLPGDVGGGVRARVGGALQAQGHHFWELSLESSGDCKLDLRDRVLMVRAPSEEPRGWGAGAGWEDPQVTAEPSCELAGDCFLSIAQLLGQQLPLQLLSFLSGKSCHCRDLIQRHLPQRLQQIGGLVSPGQHSPAASPGELEHPRQESLLGRGRWTGKQSSALPVLVGPRLRHWGGV